MQLNINKTNQGPVLAKGKTTPVTDNTSCGIVSVNGSNMGGCATTTDGGGTWTYGASPSNGGSAGVQYSSTITCC